MRLPSPLRLPLVVASLALAVHANAAPFTVTYDGDATPDSPSYASIFSTVVFADTSWSSDGDNKREAKGGWEAHGIGGRISSPCATGMY